MSDTSGLTPPGSAVYDSNTMYVGDGTWDANSNTFLLPNLQGLNFDTMRYNGMGNRFSQEPTYQQTILAHGILAAITFLFLVPGAILFIRFAPTSGRVAVRIHIWCQVLTLFTTTALFALGVSAVGHNRSLTNPHHGIGVAIYILILFQFFLGWITYRRGKKRRKPYAPVKAVLHSWLGRAIALLGIAQVALGLTLYGSPLWLFIMYALIIFAWILLYFVQSYLDQKYHGEEYGSEYSWDSDDRNPRRKHGRFSTIAKTAAAGAGIAYVANKLRRRNDPPSGSHHSASYLHGEKHSDDYSEVSEEHKGGRLRKILGIGALGGLGYYLGKLWGKQRDHGSVDSASYTTYSDASDDRTGTHGAYSARPINGPAPGILPGGAPPPAALPGPTAPLSGAAAIASNHRRHDSEHSSDYSTDDEDDYSSASPSHKRRHHGIRDTVMGLGALGLARNLFKNRKAKKEQARIDELRRQDIEEERINRANSQRHRFTGDGLAPPERRASLTNTDLTPIPAGSAAGAATGAAIGAATGAAYAPQAPYEHPAYGGGVYSVDGQPLPVVPPPPRDPRAVRHSSGSELYTAPDGTPHHRHHAAADAAAAGLAGGAAGLAAGEALRNRRDRSESRRTSGSTGNTPPVSVKLNMHNDGRHVTLRRLTEEEAAADRARDRYRMPHGSASDISGGRPEGARWRRDDVLASPRRGDVADERSRLQASQTRLNAAAPANIAVPPVPPIPASEQQAGSVTSPATHDGSATEASTHYERNRRRRRAERAASGQHRQRVEFD